MVRAWYRASDSLLARLERTGAPSWVVVSVAYLVGFEIAHWLVHRK